MTDKDCLADRLFSSAIIHALENAPHKKMKLKDLRLKAQFRRGIIDQVQNMKIRGILLIYAEGPVDMDTEISLGSA